MLKNIKDIRMNKPRSATHVAHNNENSSLAPRWESKPSRGTSGARVEQESAETLSFRCDCERCRLMRGAVNNQNRGGQERCRLTRGADKPSRGTSEARGEQESAETSSFRCDCERCRLTRGAVKPNSDQDLYPRHWRESGFAYGRSEASPDSEQIEHVIAEQFMRNSVSVEQIQDRCVRRTGEGSHSDKTNRHPELVSGSPLEQISQTCIENSSLAPRGRGLGRGGLAAFTLAEVLITLGIIGVVAALTMPALITNIQDRIQQKRIENINQKLSKVTDKMAVQSGLTGYDTTMAFVQEMSKHMKIAKICDNEHLAECWPTQEVILNDEGKTWEIAKTKNAKTLKISTNAEDWADTVGIITGDGTGMILSYNKKCEFSVDDGGLKYDNSTGKSNSLVCLSGVYDWNGSSKPNKLKKDVTTLGMATGLGTECAIEVGGKCFTAAFTPTPLTKAQCEAEKDKLGINQCCTNSYCDGPDYWAGAVKQCGGISKMPTMADLTELAKVLYNTSNISSSVSTSGLTLDTSKASSMGFTGDYIAIWSGDVAGDVGAHGRDFHSSHTGLYSGYRNNSYNQAVCLGE